MKASITMEETTEFAVHAGMFPTSMKVFRISGRDPWSREDALGKYRPQ